ncbi:conserved hypothetical protein [Cupriavidus taiwanensis]|uniref:M23 family metallopeptidase n=1 Tax=Cupriavidus taiwanensis TaxID=164546 RepID=UPI000E142D5B|nr:M23 family metallopeptidase [Cupriavidus taiwanensis]SOZ14414.1 conserved hypothetical protein [Cupriavidus taiwanensis]SOZ25794.1 conserved hypothetical protein [Cupriavidus taiwanensis]SOZ45023.1 conserved hypothetical protein [Cupriavidus taiwanensis]SPA12721.1 conserved hypothetical protein [Cupriavidus taiwanensis]
MLISPPFLPSRASNQTEDQWLAAAMPGGDPGDGAYPVSYNLGWHGGLHLQAPARSNTGMEPVCAIADGVIVFRRGTSEPPAAPAPDAPLNYNGRTSDGVVIIRHETEIGAARQGSVPTRVVFFSIYMHLNTVRNTVQLGRKVHRKAELGQAGYIRGRPHQIHFEIVCDDDNLEQLVGRRAGLVALTGDGRSDAVFGEIYFHLAATTLVYPERPPRNQAKFTGGVPLGEELFVGLRYAQGEGSEAARGHAYVTTYRPTGAPLAEVLTEADAEYNLHREAQNIAEAYPVNARPSPSAVYELLRFGRVMGPDALVPPDIPHWRRICTPAGARWVNLGAQDVRKFSDADFPHWRGWHLIEDTQDGNCLCNEPAILRVADVNRDGSVDIHEAHSRLAAPEVKKFLRRLICKFPTEWEAATFDSRWGWLKTLNPANPNPMSNYQFARLRAHAEALAFWEHAGLCVPEYDSQGRPTGERPFPSIHWRFDPREFVGVFRRSGWLSLNEFKQIYHPTPIEMLERYYVHLNIIMRKYAISSGSRQSHFLGQGAVESDFLRAMQERSMEGQIDSMRVLGRKINPRSTQPESELGHWYGSGDGESDPWFYLEKYNSRGLRIAGSYSWRNGNCGDVDAQKFRGRGFKQITGLDNYAEYWVYRGWLSRASFTPGWWGDPAYGRRDAARMTRIPAQIDNPQFIAVDSYSCIDSGGWYMMFRRPNVMRSIDEDVSGIAVNQAEGAAESAISRRVTYAINGGYNDDLKRLEYTRLVKKVLL